jgi:hypothetical protein
MINCIESKVTLNVKGEEAYYIFPKKNSNEAPKKSVNAIEPSVLTIGSFEISIPPPKS